MNERFRTMTDEELGTAISRLGPEIVWPATPHVGRAVGATILVLGLDATPFELTAQALVRRQLVLRGSLTYDHPGDFAATPGDPCRWCDYRGMCPERV